MKVTREDLLNPRRMTKTKGGYAELQPAATENKGESSGKPPPEPVGPPPVRRRHKQSRAG